MININGKIFQYDGNGSISVENGKVYINGKLQNGEDTSKEVHIKIEGNVDKLDIVACSSLSINGNVTNIDSGSGDVNVEGDAGSIKTGSGDVEVGGNVDGDIETGSGDVDISGHVTGNVSTKSGDISHH